jgi:hypothetical protein
MSQHQTIALTVTSGALAGTRFRLEDGRTVVGRTSECTCVVADPSLSRRHFELWPEEKEWHVQDLQSRNGIAVNGTVVRHAVVRAGDEIRAGDVTFRLVAVTARLADPDDTNASPPPAGGGSAALRLFPTVEPTLSAEAPPPASMSLAAALVASLRPSPTVYALIDGAQAFELAFAARLMGHELYTIFSGDLAGILAHVGPCLVVIGERSAFLAEWVKRVGTHVGVLFESTAEFESLCRHLRHIFVATDEEHQKYFFRFYDPRVLRTFLPTCHAEELKEFFGPIDRWVAEAADASAFTSFTISGAGLSAEEIRAARPAGRVTS